MTQVRSNDGVERNLPKTSLTERAQSMKRVWLIRSNWNEVIGFFRFGRSHLSLYYVQ